MFHDDNPPQLGRFEFGIIKKKVRQIIGRAGFTWQDREDLEQELMLRILQSLRRFDPAVAHKKSFVTAVVERDVATILRDKKAGKRDHRRCCSLNVRIDLDDESVELAETISDREQQACRGLDLRDEHELAQLISDVRTVVQSMAVDQRELAERLQTDSISAIARDLNLPRTTVSSRLRKIQRRFEQAGLRDYLHKP